MNSIMQEASSITKAIELGWIKAGQPKEFTVKIYEEPEKNFFGITTKSAKIAIFFTQEEKPKKKEMPKLKPSQPQAKEKLDFDKEKKIKEAPKKEEAAEPKIKENKRS